MGKSKPIKHRGRPPKYVLDDEGRELVGLMGQITRRILLHDATKDDTYTEAEADDNITDYLYLYAGGPVDTETTYYNDSGSTKAITHYDYDALGRKDLVTNPDASTIDYEYDENSRVKRVQVASIDLANGTNNITMTTDMIYDELGRLKYRIAKPQNPDAPSDTSWQTTEFVTYDPLGNLKKEKRPNGVLVDYEYDMLGRRTKQTVDQADLAQVTEYSYDALGRQKTITGYLCPKE